MATRPSNKCEWLKPGGSRCQANAVAGSRFCWFHHPEKTEERARARRAGGLARNAQNGGVLPADAPDAILESFADIANLLGRTVNMILKGQLNPRVGTATGYLSGLLMIAREKAETDARLDALEAHVFGRSADRDV